MSTIIIKINNESAQEDLVLLRKGEERRGLLLHVECGEALEGGDGTAAVLVALLHLFKGNIMRPTRTYSLKVFYHSVFVDTGR